jgi:solute carrier family 25 2-oxodicarboxylate transporter 21
MATEPLPFYKTLIAGGSAGILEICCMYPLDVVKTRMQLGTGPKQNMFGALKSIVEKEGAANLYRGVFSPILAEAPKRAMKFTCNDTYSSMLGNCPSKHIVAGASAGITEVLVNCPTEVVKVRMQDTKNLKQYPSTMSCLQDLLKKEGPRALYKGAEAQAWRNGVWNGVYFGLIGNLKEAFPMKDGANPMWYKFKLGVVGGTLATLANTPFDTIKSRMQGANGKTPWTLPTLVKAARENGVRSVYSGLGPRLARLGPGGGIMLVAFETVKGWLA